MGVFAILAQYFHTYFHLKIVKGVGERRAKGRTQINIFACVSNRNTEEGAKDLWREISFAASFIGIFFFSWENKP